MSARSNRLRLLVILLCVLPLACKPAPAERTALPPAVATILLGDPSIQDVLKGENLPIDKLPSEWFLASEVHLAGENDHSLIVMADGRLRGANITTFWVFRASAGGYEPLLSEPAHDLVVKDTSSNGYRGI